MILLLVGTPIAWWLARSAARWKEAVAAVVALPLVLPPTVLGFYLLIALGPNGPGGWIASLGGGRSLAFTFEGLVIGSVVYSMPFVVQPIRNAFEAFGERPLEVAATLRASPRDAFWTVAVPLARPGFLTGAVLGFAHTVGEFGVVLMIGGNIPGETKVLSVAIYDYVETLRWTEAHILSAGMLVFSVLRHPRDDLDREARGAARRMSSERAPIVARFRGALGAFALDAALRGADARRDRAVRPVGLRQDDGAALRRRAADAARRLSLDRRRGLAGRRGISGRPTSGRSATCFRRRACSRISRCGAICSTATAAPCGAAPGGDALRRRRRAARDRGPCSTGRRCACRAASASGSRSGALCSRSPGCCSWTSRWPGSTA